MSFLQHRRKAFRGGVVFDFTETFEASEYDNTGWTEGGGSVNGDYTADPLRGTNSMQITANNNFLSRSLTASSSKSFFWRFRGTNSSSPITVFRIYNSTTQISEVNYRGSVELFSIEHGSASANSSTGVLTAFDTDCWIWLDWAAGGGSDGTMSLYVSETSTKPGAATVSLTNGTATSDVDLIRLHAGEAGMVYDDFIYNSTTIGSNPEP